ncbi:uncharacterized protein Z518_03477 [Rhinocladiella mackenziei CBS 650.93]|uniref:Uncharacterized protein n=1 Tax=Rhinocladiella mackenziei CBS 650.93 TaxID=1442369 RepID=A0A0D2JHJ1_9EURO|nr:uncharacterized protein Z518_03477 [Rhinocladiella mackenziei CBS 650.93]KIX08820.1 hypothetical protein Z518_03477 [Rhinocladiella mackenziei CBS 650.93]
MAQPQPQPQVPDPANIQAATNGMTAERNTIAQSAQAYNVHQNRLTDELTLCANYPVGQMQQQLADLQRTLQRSTDKIRAETWNLRAQIQNGKLTMATGALTSMRSVDPGDNPQVPIGNAIPNFPATPDDISDMNGNSPFQCISF